jgi:hypothetical protein
MKIVKLSLLSLVLLVFVACGNKLAFKPQEPLQNAALVYVYAVENIGDDENTNESDFSIRINNKPVMQRIIGGEYMVFNLKPVSLSISATKKEVEEKVLKLDLKASHIYYLRITDNLEDGRFAFEVVDNSIASKEIQKTGLAGTNEESPENIITEFVNPTKKSTESVEVVAKPKAQQNTTVTQQQVSAPSYQAPTVAPVSTSTMSKTDEIMKAYSLKEKGIINDDEFKALKSDILKK